MNNRHQDWVSHFKSIRNYTTQLVEPLSIEDYIPQPVLFISPPKWHLGHTTWFFEQFILKPFKKGYKEFDPQFGFLFNSYYNNVGERTLRNQRGNMTRPEVARVMEYRRYVDTELSSFLEGQKLNPQIQDILEIGLNHEQQHQELMITDFKYVLGNNPLNPVYKTDGGLVHQENKESGWIEIEEGLVEIGFSGDGFSFDNEHGNHKQYLSPGKLSKSLVTNGEFMEFMEAGGYDDFNYWLDEGWYWRLDEGISHPMYWKKLDGKWHQFTLGGLVPVNPNEILSHISYYEAYAYASFRNCRLPSEFEWEAYSHHFEWGTRWEFTQSAYLPYPNYKKAEGAIGEYNGKFMINQMVLRGSSVATSEGHSRRTYRNFFHPNLQWQFSGIRLAQ